MIYERIIMMHFNRLDLAAFIGFEVPALLILTRLAAGLVTRWARNRR